MIKQYDDNKLASFGIDQKSFYFVRFGKNLQIREHSIHINTNCLMWLMGLKN
jgi:hypothetical protein